MRVGGFHPGQKKNQKHACKSSPAQQAAGLAAVSYLKVHVRLQGRIYHQAGKTNKQRYQARQITPGQHPRKRGATAGRKSIRKAIL